MPSSWFSLRERVLAVSRRVSLTIASLLLLINLGIILYAVFLRYLAGGAPIWTDELARFLIIAGVMLAAGAVWVEGGHMRVALIERLLPTSLCRLLNLYQWLLTLGLAIGGALFSYRYAQSVAMFTSSGLGISRTIPMMSMPIGFALLAWHALWYGPAPLKTLAESDP
ncbi:TRAP-type C4-dicarboxylate transport system, small permease component [Modicisalibacter ilicicola DSM 19980]|uniref:TRAP transporter small permease protein n=1 Tax=Modicisalibacter ilicicola DSM 19980 TaxID=1121942 RepID=A0A1M4WAG8_9GAMM|nr:TRAP transporter small permease subunit [Halomonas ilicicola]SHE78261.1 TRAP-type C4-dicarboxylate transport system, small permease component [Halomonas ilicicola DSM 19980]